MNSVRAVDDADPVARAVGRATPGRASGASVDAAGVAGSGPTVRLVALLEAIASTERLFSLQGLAVETGLPKPTLHRMLQQLESVGLVQREGDGRHWSPGARLRRLAESLLMNGGLHGARHAVLRRLVDEVGESCNITALSGDEVVYLDRVETAAPLRVFLHPGSRVPVHCSASGKLFLSQMTPAQRRRLLGHAPLERCTPATLTDLGALEDELRRVAADGHALDLQEFLPGLVCVAVPVPAGEGGRSMLCVAVQAPSVRMTPERALQWLPALRRAAQALSDIHAEADAASDDPETMR